MNNFRKYLVITLILSLSFAIANIIYNIHLNSLGNFDFAYNYSSGISEDVGNLNRILPDLTKNISINQFESLLYENDVSLNSVIVIDSFINYTSGQIRFQFNKDSLLQSIKVIGYSISSYDSTKSIGSPSISYLFGNDKTIKPFIRVPQFLSLIFIFIFILTGIITLILFYFKHSKNLNLLVISTFSFLVVIVSTFLTLFFYFNYSFQISPLELMFVHNYINPQLLLEAILSFSKFRSILFDINMFAFLMLFYFL